jgi:AcrR family transcriptional regulator
MATRTSDDAPSAPKRLPADRRRQQLLDVALALFAERGYNATTMDDTAEAAGVTKPLLYQHFDSKRALYLELVDSVATTMLDAIGKAVVAADGPRQQVESGFSAYFHLVVTHPAAFNLLFGSNVPNDPELSRAVRSVQDTIAEAIDPLIDAGLDQDHRRLLAYAMVGMAEGASHHFVATRDPVEQGTEHAEASRLARRLAEMAWAGLRSVHPD